MKLTLVFYAASLFLLTACSTANHIGYRDQAIEKWGSPEGIARLEQSKFKVDFFKLANHFESQHNKIFCGPASATIVLNALRIRNGELLIPEDKTLLSKTDLQYFTSKTWSPFFQRYTQNNIFQQSPKSRELVLGEILLDKQGEAMINSKGKPKKDRGFQLHQLGELFKNHGLKTQVRVVNQDLEMEIIKKEIIENLKTTDDYVIVNYKRSVLNQPGGGHISPLGAYHQASDSFLIMDVTPNKADWIWVKTALLLSAMRTFDTVENRGYLLIREEIK